MQLRIVTPVRPLIETEATELVAPGSEGEFGVLPQHVTFLGGLRPGIVSWVEDGSRRKVVVSGGYTEVREDVVTILADDAELPDEVDGAQARQDITRIQEELARGGQSAEESERLLTELALAEARIAVGA